MGREKKKSATGPTKKKGVLTSPGQQDHETSKRADPVESKAGAKKTNALSACYGPRRHPSDTRTRTTYIWCVRIKHHKCDSDEKARHEKKVGHGIGRALRKQQGLSDSRFRSGGILCGRIFLKAGLASEPRM